MKEGETANLTPYKPWPFTIPGPPAGFERAINEG